MKDIQKAALEKLPPHNLEAERSVLGAILLDPEYAIPVALREIAQEDFFNDSHRIIFTRLFVLWEQHKSVDLLILRDLLQREGRLDTVGGPAYLSALVDVVPTAANVTHHARIVKQAALARRLLYACTETVLKCYDYSDNVRTLLNEARDAIMTLNRQVYDGEKIFWKQSATGQALKIEEDKFLRFLSRNGYFMLDYANGTLFVQEQRNILQETEWVKSTNKSMKQFLKKWAEHEDRNDVWKCILKKNQLFSHASLTGLDSLDSTFYADNIARCTLFFQNCAVEITPDAVRAIPHDAIDGLIWREQMSRHHYYGRHNRQIKARLQRDYEHALKIGDTEAVACFRYIKSRIQYAEKRDGRELTDIELDDVLLDIRRANLDTIAAYAKIAHTRPDLPNRELIEHNLCEQYSADGRDCDYKRLLTYISQESLKDHTGNTIKVDNLHAFEDGIARLIHAFNIKACMRVVIFADSNPSWVAEGRRGKGIILQVLREVLGSKPVVLEDGKSYNPSAQFKFQRLSATSRTLILDDVSEKFDFQSLYSAITEGLDFEVKGVSKFKFDLERNPKIALTTNHPCYGEDRSSQDRAILLPVTDYFATQKKTPHQVFGHMLYDDWDEAEWNRCFDYLISIVQQYLNRLQKDPSMVPDVDLTIYNANKLLLRVPEAMVDYLDGLELEVDYRKDEMIAALKEMNIDVSTSQKFKQLLNSYCKLRGRELFRNTSDGRNKSGGVEYVRLIPLLEMMKEPGMFRGTI